MTLPEVRTYLERAAAARAMLDGLLDVLSEAHLLLNAGAGEWDVRTHLAHVATADGPVAALLREVERGRPAALAPEGEAAFFEMRARAIEQATNFPLAALREMMAESRHETEATVRTLSASHLDLSVALPARDAWGRQASIAVRDYLAAWAVHDVDHERTVRRAIVQSPSPAALAAASRLQRRPPGAKGR